MSALRFVPVVSVVIAGCMSADVLRLDPSPRPSTSPDSVRVLAQEPSQPYSVLAIVTVQAGVLGSGSLLELTHGLRDEAAKLGGNGVLIGPESVTQTHKSSSMSARVILFDSVAPPAQPALAKPGRTGRIVMWSILGGVLVAGTVAAILAADNEPIIVSCDPGTCFSF